MNKISEFFRERRNKTASSESGSAIESKIFLPDLTIWYRWHSEKGTLPDNLSGKDLEEVCRLLEVPVWNSIPPWKEENSVVEITREHTEEKRTTQFRYKDRTLTAVWIKGPDGDWWQSEYPVKTPEDLDIIASYLEGRSFAADTAMLLSAAEKTGDAGIVVPALPARAFAWLMLEIVGWSEGLMVLMEGLDKIAELIAAAEKQIQNFTASLVRELTGKGFSLFLSPDNLDGMFISPGYFKNYLFEGYSAAARVIHQNDASLIVHGGGPLGGILDQISASGVDCIAGISGPPQGDSPIGSAREKAGEDLILWGGIPQDFLMENSSPEEFQTKIRNIISDFSQDQNSIIGIADHVPLNADISRLQQIARIIASDGEKK